MQLPIPDIQMTVAAIAAVLVAAAGLLGAVAAALKLLPVTATGAVIGGKGGAAVPPRKDVVMSSGWDLADWLYNRLGSAVGPLVADEHQCVAAINDYLEACRGLPATTVATAAELATIKLPGFIWTPNGPANAPGAGAVVVWGEDSRISTGPAGHTAVAMDAGPNHLISADQNWAGVQRVETVAHNYWGVLGWHEPATAAAKP
jgi:hypothetical protein